MYILHGRLPLGKRNVWLQTALQTVEEIAQWEAPNQANGGTSSLQQIVSPKKSPFPEPRSQLSSLSLRLFHTSYGRPVQIGSAEAPANL